MKKTVKIACLGISLVVFGLNFASMAVGPTCLRHCKVDCGTTKNPRACFARFCSICFDQSQMTPRY